MEFSVPHIQVKHHRALYLDHLPEAVIGKYKDTSGLSDLEIELFIDTSMNWELEELRIVGYVSLYHLWERYSKTFISNLFGKPKSEWPRLSRSTYPNIVTVHLRAFGFSTPAASLEVIEEANTVLNAWKHGEEAVEKLRTKHPEYLGSNGDERGFHVPQSKLEALFDAAEHFWESLREQAKIDYRRP